jgi:hypothetical protein
MDFEKTEISNSMPIRSVGELFHVDRGTYRRTDMTELTVDLHNSVNVPKNSVRTSQNTQ